MRLRSRAVRILSVLAVLALLAATCGEDDAGDRTAASDTTEAVADEPADDGPTDTAAEVPTTEADPEEAGPRYADGDADVIFDDDRVNTFELTLDPQLLAFLDADPAAEEYVEGSLTFDGETIDGVGIRYKGSSGAWYGCVEPTPEGEPGAKTCPKLSMKVKITYTDSDAEFYGQRRLNFHSLNMDTTLMHDRLGYWLYREMGVPAPRFAHVRLIVNGEFVGLFGLVEQIDGRFTRANFEDGTGNLYKEVWPTDDTGSPQASQVLLDALKTNEDENPSVDLIAGFADEIAAAGPADAAAVLERWTDVEQLLAHTAVDRTIRHDDGPFHWKCPKDSSCSPHNYYWYEDPSEEKVYLLPWDLDLAFLKIGEDDAGYWGAETGCDPQAFLGTERPVTCDPIVAAIASLDTAYEAVRAELLAGPFSPEQTDAQLDRWSAQIAEVVAEAEAAHDGGLSVAQWEAALVSLRESLEVARAE